MATVPPNPFDPEEVQKFLDSKETNTAVGTDSAAPGNAVGDNSAARVMDTAQGTGLDTPTAEAVTMLNYWAKQGADVYAEAVLAIVDAVASTAVELEDVEDYSTLDPDAVVVSTRLGKSIEKAGKGLYYAGRAVLWEIAEHTAGKFETPGGDSYTFKAGARTSTRVDSKRLKAEYPDVYDKVATTTTKSADTPGTLYL